VRGRGAATANGTGDLLVTVDVAVPSKLSEAEREALGDLADAFADAPSPRAYLDQYLQKPKGAEG
jgi:molecular chaperone DnaJ